MCSVVERTRVDFVLSDDLRYRFLKLLAEEPQISQRDVARRLGISVGKANYCLSALVETGLVKIDNVRKASNKLAYAYLLTPRGIEEKTRITVGFLQRKMREYGDLQQEIEVLRREVMATGSGECYVNVDALPQQIAAGD